MRMANSPIRPRAAKEAVAKAQEKKPAKHKGKKGKRRK